MPGAGRYRDLLEKDADLRRWHDNLAAGSRITADVHLRQLGLVCRWWGTDPQGILTLARRRSIQTRLEDEVRRLEREGYAGDYIQHVIRGVTSWMEYNGLKLFRKIKVANSAINPTIQDERVPEKEELSRIFRSLDLRGRAIAATLAFSGLRIETVGNYDGTDGLVLSDLPELRVSQDKIEVLKTPMMLRVRPTLSKHRRPYFTFLAGEGCDYLKEYLESRLRAGESLGPDDPVFGHKSAMAKRRFLWATKVGSILRGDTKSKTGIRGAGFPWRPYVLRSYCDTAFDIAEAKGLISHPWRQFFMGHKGDIEARYSTNKGRLPPDMIEEMRAAYKRCEPLLQTIGVEGTSEEKMKETFRREILKAVGFSQDEIDEIDMGSMGDEEFQSMLRQKLLGMMTNNGAKQKVIRTEEVEGYLTQGWEFVATLPNDRAIIKIPF